MRLTKRPPRGGYNVPLAGRAAGEVQDLPPPTVLRLPLRGGQFHFQQVLVSDGDRAGEGQMLARDDEHFGVPLLAPRAGTVRIDPAADVITLSDLAGGREPPPVEAPPEHAKPRLGHAAEKRRKLLHLGAWQFFRDPHTGALPNPFARANAVIISTLALEPHSLRGDVQLEADIDAFTRGLEHLQGLLEYQEIYFVIPDTLSQLAEHIRSTVRGYAHAEVVTVPTIYPHEDFRLVTRRLGLKPGPPGDKAWQETAEGRLGNGEPEQIWALRVEGILAIDRVMTHSMAVTERIVAVGGPGVGKPTHVRATVGYPIKDILEYCEVADNVRVLDGGALTGRIIDDPHQAGLSAETTALTVLPDQPNRELVGFLRPGGDRQSFSRCFLSALKRPFAEPLTTMLRGERRACVACGLCEDVCPARIWPHLIHKHLFAKDLEEAQRAGVERCIGCGLCSYVCVSKIELARELLDAQTQLAEQRIEDEKLRAEAEAAERAAAERAAEAKNEQEQAS